MTNKIKKLNSSAKGFTLVELLIVIAIIGILAGAVLVVINPAQLLAKSRDSQRLEEVDALHKAMTLALADGEVLLVDTTGVCATCTSDAATPRQSVDGTNGWVKYTLPTGKTGLGKYIPTLPTDPSTNAYSFASEDVNQTYEINVVLESADNLAKMGTDGGDNAAAYEVGTAAGLALIN